MTLLYGKRADTETLYKELFPKDTEEHTYFEKCHKIVKYFEGLSAVSL